MNKAKQLELKEAIDKKRDELNELIAQSERHTHFDNDSILAIKTPMGIVLKIFINKGFELSIAMETSRNELGETTFEIEDIRVFDLMNNELTADVFKEFTNQSPIPNTGIRIRNSSEFIKLLNLLNDL